MQQYKKDVRTVAAIALALLTLYASYEMLHWVASLSHIGARAGGAMLIVLLYFIMVIGVICITEPEAIRRAAFEHRMNRIQQSFDDEASTILPSAENKGDCGCKKKTA